MIDLFHTLQGNDLGFYKMVAGAWGIELKAADTNSMLHSLVKDMLKPRLVDEVISVLPQDALDTLHNLMQNDGMMPWALFSNQHGEVRSMGPAKRDRERPDLYPASPAEVLWYRGLIGKAFLDVDHEPQEYAFIPDDIIPFIITISTPQDLQWGRHASPKEITLLQPAGDHILDDACTLLAALRLEVPPASIPAGFLDIHTGFLVGLLKSTGMIEEDLTTQPEAVREFLEEERGAALARLVNAWMSSRKINELRMLPHLGFEGTWTNYPFETRSTILEFISTLEEGAWWSLPAFVQAVRERAPDFQRPAGDYDSWFVLEKETGEYLKGRGSWEKVDGALLRFILCGPMHWLGLLDLARPSRREPVSAFRLTRWAQKLWHGSPPEGLPREEDPVVVNTDGVIRVSNKTPRAVRYQVARFGEWETRKDPHYLYRITPHSLKRAQGQGLRSHHLVGLLKKHAPNGIAPALLEALSRWEKSGVEVRVEPAVLLRVEKPEIISQLMNTPAKRFLGEVLNPTTVEVKKGHEAAVQKAIFQLGYLTEASSSFSVITSDPSS